uniref:Integrase, catalytic region, zinc finger, CCHC-type, peptidase aspartic, catalytic n=1 Tax=Tanacetum cinerariifolium TaxID=118510 RepID=A0A6L2KJP3_TANCI|nr:integrase, catalytic region, zinc finger, CCHC-type, peptidase aspartic, catalytic [Tanacetum cinerariifolium]
MENGRTILNSVQNGPFICPTVTDEDGLPPDVYSIVNHHKGTKEIWDRVKLLMQGMKLSLQEKECLTLLVFNQGDDLIACLNKAMSFLTAIASSRFPSTNNQLRTSSNPRNQATIQDGRVTVQQVKRRQGQSYFGTGYKGNATSFRGNNTSGQARVVKCYNCHGEGHMARQCTQPKRPQNLAWFKEKAMLAEAEEAGKILGEEQLAFLADLGILDAILMANLSSNGSDVLSEEKANQEKKNVSLTAELERYKEQVKTFEQRFNIDLSTREKMIDSQMDYMIKDKLALKQQIDSLEQKISNQIKEKESLLQRFAVFKNESKEKESKYMDKEIDLEKNIKELDNIVYKVELSDEQAFWLQTSHPNTDQSTSSPVKIEAPQELPKEHDDSLIAKLNSKSVENADLKCQIQDKVFVNTSLKNDLQKLKGIEVKNASQIPIATTISPGMFKLDLDPLVHRLSTLFSGKFLGTVRFENDQVAKIMWYGDFQLGNVIISKNLEGVDLLSGSSDTNLYTMSLDDMPKTSLICILSKASKTKSWLWHRRFLRSKDEAPGAIIKCIKNIQVRLNDTVFPIAIAPRVVDTTESPVSTSIDLDAPSASIPSTQEHEHSLINSQGYEESPKTPHFHDDSLHESLHEDSTSQGSSSNVRPTHTLFEHLGRWTKDHPIANVIDDPSRFVSTRKQLKTDVMWCYFDAFLTFIEPKNFKQAMSKPSWIDAMQEEIHEFQRLQAKLTEKHLNVVKRIFRYLKGTINMGLNINPVVAKQVALDNSLVPSEKRLKIEKCNARIEFIKPQREETYQVTLDALKLSSCYPAFLITAEVPEVYMHQFWNTIQKIKDTDAYRFKLDKKKFRVDTEVFCEILQICPILHNQAFVDPSLKEELDDFMYQANNKEIILVRKEHMPYPRFNKVIVSHFFTKDKTISMRNNINLHIIRDDSLLDFATGKATPKKARKFKKVASSLRKVYLVLEEELAVKPNEFVPKKKTPAKVDRGKGMYLLSDVALLEATQLKKTLKKSKMETHKIHASGLGDGVSSQPKVPVEQENKTTRDSDDDDDSDEVTKDDDEDDGESDVDDDKEASDSKKTDSDEDENLNLNQNDDEEEENKEEYARTPDSIEFNDDDEEYEKLYKDVNIRLQDTGHEGEGKGDEEITNVGYNDTTQQIKYDQVKDDKHVTLTTVHDTQNTEDSEVVSMMNVKVCHEEQSTQTPPLLNIHVTVIRETSSYTTEFEKKAKDERKRYIDLVEKSVKDIIKYEIKSKLPQILEKEVSDFATPVIQSSVTESLKNIVLAKSSSQPKSTYEVAASLTESELKILIDKIQKSKSCRGAQEHKDLYDALVKSYKLDKQLFESYRKVYRYASNRQSKHDVFSTKRIIVVTHVKVMKWYDYGYLEEIVVRREDQQLYEFKEGDFPRLNLRDIEDLLLLLVQKKLSNLEKDVIFDLNVALRMFTRCIVILKRVEDLQLGVKSYQKKLNITRPKGPTSQK